MRSTGTPIVARGARCSMDSVMRSKHAGENSVSLSESRAWRNKNNPCCSERISCY